MAVERTSAALLEALLAFRSVLDDDHGERRAQHAKKEVVLALQEGSVMLAMATDGPAVGRSATARVMCGFTDEEAYGAWVAQRPAGAVEPPAPIAIDGGPDGLGRLFGQGSITAIVVNPAGPAGAAVHVDDEYRKVSSPLIRHRPSARDHPWLEPSSRVNPRLAIGQLAASARAAVEQGELARFDALIPRFRDAATFGDLVGHSALLDLIAESTTWRGDAPTVVARAWLSQSKRWAELGDTERGAAALVKAATALIEGLDTGVTPGTAPARQALAGIIREIDALGLAPVPPTVARVRAVASRWAPELQ